MNKPLAKGDYVLATKYSDGDPGDQYAVGYFHSMLPKLGGDRYMVTDNSGKPFRMNGFRRAERITDAEGRWMIERFPQFQPFVLEEDDRGDAAVVGKSLWDWLEESRLALNGTGER